MLVSEMTLSIAGSAKRMAEDSLSVSYEANGRARLRVAVVSNDSSYVPAIDAEVTLTDPVAGSQFGGYITTPTVAGVFDIPLVPITTTIDVPGYAAIATRRFVNEVIPPGTLKAALQRIVPYLSPFYGVTLDGAQVNGPPLPALVLDYIQFEEVLNLLASLSGYIWEFNGLVLRMYAPGAIAAPFNVVDGNGKAVGDITVTTSRLSQMPYVNLVRARSTSEIGWIYGETHLGDGATRFFQLNRVAVALATDISPALIVSNSVANPTVITTLIPHQLTTGQSVDIADVVGSSPSINGTYTATVIDTTHFSVPVNVTVAGTGGTWIRSNVQGGSVSVYGVAGVFVATFAVGVYGIDDMPWTFDASTNALRQRADQTVVPASGGYVLLSYAVRPVATAENTSEQAAHGIWEIVLDIDAPTLDLFTFANAYLLSHVAIPKTVVFQTYDAGLKPGMTLTITIASRGVNNTFLITDVQLNTEGDRVVWTVTAVEGSVYKGSWQDTFTKWDSGQVSSGAAVAGAVSAGSGGAVSAGGYFWLGGNANTYVQSSTPTWVPIDGKTADPGTQVILDTLARGSVSVEVTARLRARAGTVTARLRNVSDGVTVGTSAVVSTATFQTVQFACTLTPGSKVYQLELLPSLADTDVAGIAWGQ